MTNNKLAQQLAIAEARASGRSGGSGSSTGLLSSDKSVDKIIEPMSGLLQELSDKPEFSQGDVDSLNRAMEDVALKLSSAQATPYAQQVLRRQINDYEYAIRHMQQSASGNKLDYSVNPDVQKMFEKKE